MSVSFDSAVIGAQRIIGNTLSAVYDTVDPIVFRKEVAIERWIKDHGLFDPIKETKKELIARGYSLLGALEGCVRTVAAAVAHFFAAHISRKSNVAEKHQRILKTQMQSTQLCAMAAIS